MLYDFLLPIFFLSIILPAVFFIRALHTSETRLIIGEKERVCKREREREIEREREREF